MGRADHFHVYGRLAIAASWLLAVILAAFLAGATRQGGDAVPRPLAIGLLFAVPGVIGGLGLAGRRRSLLLSAAALCLVASFVSFTLVTLVMLIPTVLFAIAAGASVGRPDPRRGDVEAASLPLKVAPLPGTILGPAVTALVLAAGWALLVGLTTSGCWAIPDGEGCGSGLISVPGVVAASALVAAALAVAAGAGRLRA